MKKIYFLASVLILGGLWLPLSGNAQLIFTKAGSDNVGDYGIATEAYLLTPHGLALDASGNLFIADYGNHRIRRIDAGTGIITTIAGTGTAGFSGDGASAILGKLNTPGGIVLDGSGNLFIADRNNNRIRRIDAVTGFISTIAGTGTAGFSGDAGLATAAQLNAPYGVTFDGNGNLLIADRGNHRIRKLDAVTRLISTIAGTGTAGSSGDGGAATACQVNSPYGMAVDASGNVYIADFGNYRIRKITAATGIITTIAGSTLGLSGDGGAASAAKLYNPTSVSVNAAGDIYIADYGNHRIRKITATTGFISTVAGTTSGFSGDGGVATAAKLSNPSYVIVDGNGNLLIADYNNSRLRKVTAVTGVITTIAGTGSSVLTGDNGPATAVRISGSFSTAVDGTGNLYINDFNNHRIRKVAASTGIISTIAGTGVAGSTGDGGLATAAQLNNPWGLLIDASGNLLFAEFGGNCIRKIFTGTGIIATVAGTGTLGFSGDGGPATAATFNRPAGIALDGSGNIYIADRSNNRIRKITVSTGLISTIAGTNTAGFSGDGAAATAAILNSPSGVAVDGSKNVYIADRNNNRIRKISATTGFITTLAGTATAGFSGDSGPASLAQLNSPYGVTVDANGNLYIPDFSNNRIRKVSTSTGIISTIVGTGTAGNLGDGGPATAAQISSPAGVTLDGSGNLFISSTSTPGRIRYICAGSTLPSLTTSIQQIAVISPNNTIFFNEDCHVLSQLTPSGSNPVLGPIADTVWVETVVPLSSGQPYLQRHYGITPTLNASQATGTITLYYTQAEFTAYNSSANHGPDLPIDATDAANNKDNLQIIKRNGTSNNGTGLFNSYSGAATTIIPASVAWNAPGNRWDVTFNVTGFSGFFAASVPLSVLPLNLLDFKGRLQNGEGLLSWKTANEVNTALFEVERSVDGTNFTRLGEVKAAGTYSSRHEYNYTDRTIANDGAAVVFYRLKMVDQDAKFTYSNVIAINISSPEAVVALYPNPALQTATLMIGAVKKESITISIVDQNGRTITRKKADINNTTNNIPIDLASLPAGFYTLSITGVYTNKKIKLVKK